MNDKENALFPIDQNKESSETDIKINGEYIIPTNETSYEEYDEQEEYEAYDGEEYWNTYDKTSTDVQSYHNSIVEKLRRWKWRIIDICVLILLILLI